VASLRRDAVAIGTTERATVDSIVARSRRRVIARGDRTLDVLLLCGGGQMGA
jgi:hypothetical protein